MLIQLHKRTMKNNTKTAVLKLVRAWITYLIEFHEFWKDFSNLWEMALLFFFGIVWMNSKVAHFKKGLRYELPTAIAIKYIDLG